MDSSESWARALTDERLAADLTRLADNVRWCTATQRSAVLREAARRLATREGAVKHIEHYENMLDITAPDHPVEVQIREDETVLWVNVDGLCVLRICRMKGMKIIHQGEASNA
jgi:hypothetical protein